MHVSIRYMLYAIICTLGACALGPSYSEDRSDWGTLFADANMGVKPKSPDAGIDTVGKGGKR